MTAPEKRSKLYMLRKRPRLSSEMQIHFMFRNEKLLQVFVIKPTELKQRIQHSKGISADQQNLILDNSHQPLTRMNMRTLIYCGGIGSSSTLLLESDVCQCQQVQIFIQFVTYTTSTIKLDALLSDNSGI